MSLQPLPGPPRPRPPSPPPKRNLRSRSCQSPIDSAALVAVADGHLAPSSFAASFDELDYYSQPDLGFGCWLVVDSLCRNPGRHRLSSVLEHVFVFVRICGHDDFVLCRLLLLRMAILPCGFGCRS